MWGFLAVCVITIGIVKIYQTYAEKKKEAEICFWGDPDKIDFNKCMISISKLKTRINSLETRLVTLQEKINKTENKERISNVS